jgi:hypothetical protein
MTAYRFVGIEAEITGHAKLDRFGQTVELPDGMDAEAAAALLLPADEFAAIFDGIDVEAYQMVAGHDSAPAEFQAAKREAAIAVNEFRTKTKEGV